MHNPTAGIESMHPTILIIDLVILLFFSYLSLNIPPIKFEEKPQIDTINNVYRLYYVL